MTVVRRIPHTVKNYKIRVRGKLYRSSTNTGGSLLVGIGWSGETLTSSQGVARVDLDNYATGEWTAFEFYITPTVETYKDYYVYGCVAIDPTDPLTGGDAWIAELYVEDTQLSPGATQKTASAAYVLRMDDNGKHVYISTGGVTVPNNSDVPLPIETLTTVVNNSGSTQTISKGASVTLYIAGDNASKSSLTLAARGMVTLLKVAADTWMASGNVT